MMMAPMVLYGISCKDQDVGKSQDRRGQHDVLLQLTSQDDYRYSGRCHDQHVRNKLHAFSKLYTCAMVGGLFHALQSLLTL